MNLEEKAKEIKTENDFTGLMWDVYHELCDRDSSDRQDELQSFFNGITNYLDNHIEGNEERTKMDCSAVAEMIIEGLQETKSWDKNWKPPYIAKRF